MKFQREPTSARTLRSSKQKDSLIITGEIPIELKSKGVKKSSSSSSSTNKTNNAACVTTTSVAMDSIANNFQRKNSTSSSLRNIQRKLIEVKEQRGILRRQIHQYLASSSETNKEVKALSLSYVYSNHLQNERRRRLFS